MMLLMLMMLATTMMLTIQLMARSASTGWVQSELTQGNFFGRLSCAKAKFEREQGRMSE